MLRPHHAVQPSPSIARRLGRLTSLLVAVVLLVPVAAAAVPVEEYARYQPQTNCSPKAKPGTLKLSRWLRRTYPGSGSLGISRSCKDGGVSEHKEGRAFDWAVNVHSARDRGYVHRFFTRIFATDSAGNTHALARRMGIMYLIWNDHIYSSYRGFRARAYRPCKVLRKCSATMRHRNHVHISLSRRGGAGKTSWYTRGTTTVTPPPPPADPTTTDPPPPPADPTDPTTPTSDAGTPAGGVLDLGTTPYAVLPVDANGTTTVSPFLLRRGAAYKVTVAGLYGYGAPTQVADASCRWSVAGRKWAPYPTKAAAATHGSLNLLVDGARMANKVCHPTSHRYARVFRPRSTGPLRLRIANRGAGASGGLTVVVSGPSTDVGPALPAEPTMAAAPRTTTARAGYGLITESVDVGADRSRAWTEESVQKGARYRVTVSGAADLGEGVRSDGRCLAVGGRWYLRASLDRRHPDVDHGNLYVDGAPFQGRPAGSSTACGTRTHVQDITAARTGRLELAIWEPLTRTDDSGDLTVRVQRLTPVATPRAAQPETPARTTAWSQSREWLEVDTAAPGGVLSTMRLRKGERVDLVVRGTQHSNGTDADASCVRTGSRWTASDSSVLLGQDPLDLWVDGTPVAWRSLGRDDGCSADHAYSVRYTATKNGPLRLGVLDLDHRDNSGKLGVTLLR